MNKQFLSLLLLISVTASVNAAVPLAVDAAYLGVTGAVTGAMSAVERVSSHLAENAALKAKEAEAAFAEGIIATQQMEQEVAANIAKNAYDASFRGKLYNYVGKPVSDFVVNHQQGLAATVAGTTVGGLTYTYAPIENKRIKGAVATVAGAGTSAATYFGYDKLVSAGKSFAGFVAPYMTSTTAAVTGALATGAAAGYVANKYIGHESNTDKALVVGSSVAAAGTVGAGYYFRDGITSGLKVAAEKVAPYVTGTTAAVAGAAGLLGYGSYKLASKYANQETNTGKAVVTYGSGLATAGATAGLGYYFRNGIAKVGAETIKPWASWAANGLVKAATYNKWVTCTLAGLGLLGLGYHLELKAPSWLAREKSGSNQLQKTDVVKFLTAFDTMNTALATVATLTVHSGENNMPVLPKPIIQVTEGLPAQIVALMNEQIACEAALVAMNTADARSYKAMGHEVTGFYATDGTAIKARSAQIKQELTAMAQDSVKVVQAALKAQQAQAIAAGQ